MRKTLIIARTIYYFIITPYLYLLHILNYNKSWDFAHNCAVNWSNFILSITRSEVLITGKENIPDCPVVIVSNHQSEYDIPLIFSSLSCKKIAFIAKKELQKIPFFNLWMTKIGCLFLDRRKPRKALETFKLATSRLYDKQSFVIFPEGTRSQRIEKFKKGSFHFPISAGAIILPITIIGTEKINENLQLSKQNFLQVFVHPPIDTSLLSDSEKNNIHEKIENQIRLKFSELSNSHHDIKTSCYI